jgi:hypothetical protein
VASRVSKGTPWNSPPIVIEVWQSYQERSESVRLEDVAAGSGCIAAHIGQLERDKVPVERLHPWPVAQKRTAELQQASNCPAHPN